MRNHIFFSFIIVLFGISLILPGIIYQPSLEDNPKYAVCSYLAEPNVWQCYGELPHNYSCTRIDSDIKFENDSAKLISKEKADKFCGNDWNEPKSYVMYGYYILAFGWAGVIFLGNFTWIANLFYVGLLVAVWRKEYKAIFYLAATTIIFALMAFNLSRVPRNEGGVNDYIVDHLGIGFYIWLGSIVISLIYAFTQWKKFHGTDLISPLKATFVFGLLFIVYFIPSYIGGHPQNFTKYLSKSTSDDNPPIENNPIKVFRETIATKNYRVVIQENGMIFYLENGRVTAVGDQTTKKFFIIKNDKLFIINNQEKTFGEYPIGSNEARIGIEEMNDVSLIKSIIQYGQMTVLQWEQQGNTRTLISENGKTELTFDPNTSLLVAYSQYTKESNRPTTFHFQYKEITDTELTVVKTFPEEYKKSN